MVGKRKPGKKSGFKKKKKQRVESNTRSDHKKRHTEPHFSKSTTSFRESSKQSQSRKSKYPLHNDESSSDSEEETSYQQLLSSVSGKKHLDSASRDVDSESEDNEDVDSESEDSGEVLAETTMNTDDSRGEKLTPSSIENEPEKLSEDNDSEEDVDNVSEKTILTESDPFTIHFETDLEDKIADQVGKKTSWQKREAKISGIGSCTLTWFSDSYLPPSKGTMNADLKNLHIKQKLVEKFEDTNREFAGIDKGRFTTLQKGIFSVLNNYQDLCYTDRTPQNGEQIRLVYCMHALNHVLKTRSRVVAHNTKLKLKPADPNGKEYRDQGLTRPKVLIVLPFRESALRVVNMMISLLVVKEESLVSNRKRFYSEYKDETAETSRKGYRPEEFDAIFAGNIDDHFRIGLGVAKKTLKLYTKFYSADIILASPLGLRTIIGTEGEKDRDYDFLNSIEMLILDQADVCLMQNWDHITHFMNHFHMQPQESHGVDFSRVRMWTLNGWSKYYRQTLIFSSIVIPQINSVYNRYCFNYAGKIQLSRKSVKGTICQIVVQLPQVFHRVDCSSYTEAADRRFDFFIKKVLPQHEDPVMSQTCIFIPSYFDFVRIRNYFVKEEIDFIHINEYTSDNVVSKIRNQFFHKKAHFLLYTERFHFYKRYHIRGIRHLVFYELPHFPHFYSELCNMIQDPKRCQETENHSTTVLYSKYDVQKLAGIIGTERASHMINSVKSVHMFVTGEDT